MLNANVDFLSLSVSWKKQKRKNLNSKFIFTLECFNLLILFVLYIMAFSLSFYVFSTGNDIKHLTLDQKCRIYGQE